jgi:hypothetical protein
MNRRPSLGVERLEDRQLLDASWQGLAYPVSRPRPEAVTAEVRPLPGNADTPLAAVLQTPPGLGGAREAGQTSDREGWGFLRNYTLKAIRADERVRGPLPDHDDVVQQVYLEWRQTIGPAEDSLANVLAKTSPEMQALRQTVPRVIDRTRYAFNKRRAMQDLADHAVLNRAADQHWIDLRLDWDGGVGGLTAPERQILELRRGGETLEAIGREMGMSKQWVWDTYQATLSRLQRLYAAPDEGA